MAAQLDVCRFTPTAAGTTDWTYSTAVIGYQSPTAAGAVNGAVYRYRAESADLSQWEIGYGAYNSGTGVFARTTVLFNSLGTTAKINFTAIPQVAIVALAEDLGVWTNRRLAKTAAYSAVNADAGMTIALGGAAFYALTFGAAAGYDANFSVVIVNEDATRGKSINLNGLIFVLWPGQSILAYNQNSAWQTLGRSRWKPPASATLNFYADFTNGTDVIGATDGLAPGAAAFKSAERCFLNAADHIDFNAESQTQVICNMAAATVDTQGMHSPVHALIGAQGGAAFLVAGASLAISGVVSNGGLCKITVPSTASYSANQVVSVYGVNGATGCNGTWKVTVTSATELTLQGTTFGGAYTNGGTVTNGSSFNVTGADAIGCYFGTVIQFSNVTFAASQSGIAANWGSKVYLLSGNIMGSCGSSQLFANSQGQIRATANIGISAGAANSFVQTQSHGLFVSDAAIGIDFVPGINPSYGALGFAYADDSETNFSNITINLNGNVVTGTRFNVAHTGYMATGLNNGSLTYFPGSVAGGLASGGFYDGVSAPVSAPTVTSTSTGTASISSGGGFTANDVSSNSNALRMNASMAIAANGNGLACPPSTAGLIMVSDVSVSGVGALFFIASTGNIQKLTTGGLWTNTTTPVASNFGFAWDGTNFRIYNGFASLVNFRAMSLSVS